MPKRKADHPFKKRKPSDVARRGGFPGVKHTCAADQTAQDDDLSIRPPQVQNSPNPRLLRARRAVAIIVRLGEEFPRCFAVLDRRRRPLKVGIDRDILDATATFTPDELKVGLQYYVGSPGYLAAMRAGVERVDLAGDSAGIVSVEAATVAAERAAEVKARRKPKPAPVRARPSRLSIDDLRTAARARKRGASS
jgi:sRNA-binding protein